MVSGRPISFISLLDTPRYGNRQVAELPEDRAAGPVVYSGATDVVSGVSGGAIGGVMSAPAPPPPTAAMAPRMSMKVAPGAVHETVEVSASSVVGATGATIGELFEYNFAGPVTIKKNQSAMLPFLQDKIAARKLLIYKDGDGDHPVNAELVFEWARLKQ